MISQRQLSKPVSGSQIVVRGIVHVRYINCSNMTPRLSGHFSIQYLVWFSLSLPGIARQWSGKNLQF